MTFIILVSNLSDISCIYSNISFSILYHTMRLLNVCMHSTTTTSNACKPASQKYKKNKGEQQIICALKHSIRQKHFFTGNSVCYNKCNSFRYFLPKKRKENKLLFEYSKKKHKKNENKNAYKKKKERIYKMLCMCVCI